MCSCGSREVGAAAGVASRLENSEPAVTWRDLVVVRLADDYSLRLVIGPIVFALAALVAVAILLVRRKNLWDMRRWDVVEGDIKLGGIGSVKVRPNREDAQIAHSAWVELAT